MDALAKDIKRQIRTEANSRFLRRIPLFRVENTLPNDVMALLGELDSAEQKAASGRRDRRH